MGKLSSAIVQRKLAPLRDVEEALARQVLYGGDFTTNLLEQAPTLDEHALTALIGETAGLTAAPAGELPRSSPETLRLVPGDVALRYGLYPLSGSEGRLVVVVSEPMRAEVEQDLGFGLGVTIEQRVAPLFRIRQAISRDYGLPLDRRSQRVVAKIEGRPDPSPSVAPAPLASAPDISSLPRPPSIPPLGLPAAMDMSPLYSRKRPSEPPPIIPTVPRVLAASPAPAIVTVAIEDEGAVSIHDRVTAPPPDVAPALDESTKPLLVMPVAEGPPTPPGPAAASAAESAAPPTPRAAAPELLPPPSPESLAASGPASGRKGSGQIPAVNLGAWGVGSKRAARKRSKSRHRGPYTAAAAEHDLFAAEERDAILSAFFDFACQYFEYSAVFVVHGDLAEGRDASGPGADRAVVSGIGVPLDLPSSLATARREGRFIVAPLAVDGLDARLVVDLRRPSGKRVLLLPILVRSRCVLLLYGDDGADDVDLSLIGDVIAFAPLVANALENLILKKKTAVQQAAAEGEPPVKATSLQPRQRVAKPSREDRAEALSQALQSTVRHVEPEKRPSTKPSIPSARARSKPPLPPKRDRVPTPSQGTPVDASAHGEEQAPIPLSRRASPSRPFNEVPDDGWDAPEPSPASKPRRGGSEAPEISIGVAETEADWSPEMEDVDEPAPNSLQIVVGAQKLHKRHSSEELRLPKVILNIEDNLEELAKRLEAGDEAAAERLTKLGAPAVPVLVARLPGPVSADPDRLESPRPASERGPLLRTLARIGLPAAPFVAVRTNDASAEIRKWATLLLGEMPSVESAQAVGRRVTDSSGEVRRAALEAGVLLQPHEDARTALRDRVCAIAEDATGKIEGRVEAIEALAHFRDARCVPRLVRLAAQNDELGKSAQWALGIITRQTFGRNVDAWDGWWKQNGGRHRIEWLVDALMHDETEIRRAAGEELKALTKEYFGYYDDLSKGERLKSQKRYRDWWEATGKARFSGK